MTSLQEQIIKTLLDASASPEDAKKALQDYLQNQQQAKLRVHPQSSNPVLLRMIDVRKSYKRGHTLVNALNGINLEIRVGEFVAITGASGSGKSTLLQLLGALDKPTSGEVKYGDLSLASMSDSKLSAFRRETIGFIFQFFYLQPFLKVSTNLEVPNMFAGVPRKNRRSRIESVSNKVSLSDRLSHLPKELSGGQMQRAAIARALMNQPKIILADEPTGNLDSANSEAIISLFEQIRQEFGTTIVLVTHDSSIAERADRQIVVHDGQII